VDIGRNALIEEAEHGMFVDQYVPATRLVLELGQLSAQTIVMPLKLRLRHVPAFHQAGANEDVPSMSRIDRAVRHAPARHEHEPIERNLLPCDDLRSSLSQRGSNQLRLTRCGAACSTHIGSICAATRANKRVVSTSSRRHQPFGLTLAQREPG